MCASLYLYTRNPPQRRLGSGGKQYNHVSLNLVLYIFIQLNPLVIGSREGTSMGAKEGSKENFVLGISNLGGFLRCDLIHFLWYVDRRCLEKIFHLPC